MLKSILGWIKALFGMIAFFSAIYLSQGLAGKFIFSRSITISELFLISLSFGVKMALLLMVMYYIFVVLIDTLYKIFKKP